MDLHNARAENMYFVVNKYQHRQVLLYFSNKLMHLGIANRCHSDREEEENNAILLAQSWTMAVRNPKMILYPMTANHCSNHLRQIQANLKLYLT